MFALQFKKTQTSTPLHWKRFKTSQQYQRRFGVVIQFIAFLVMPGSQMQLSGPARRKIQRYKDSNVPKDSNTVFVKALALVKLSNFSKSNVISFHAWSNSSCWWLTFCWRSAVSACQLPRFPSLRSLLKSGKREKHRSFFITTPCNFGTLRTQWHTLWSLLWTRRRDGWDTWDTWLTQLHRLRIHNPETTFHEVPSMAWDSAKNKIENEKVTNVIVSCHSIHNEKTCK